MSAKGRKPKRSTEMGRKYTKTKKTKKSFLLNGVFRHNSLLTPSPKRDTITSDRDPSR